MITQNELKERVTYSPETGVFTWLKHPYLIGKEAGTTTSHGYKRVCIANNDYYLHRLVFVYVFGAIDPNKFVDHKNGDRSDNRLNNLRLISKEANRQNLRTKSKNASKFLGVYPVHKKFLARLTVAGKTYNLGMHPTPELAHQAYQQAKGCFHAL